MRIAIFSDSWVPNLNGVVISIINEVMNLRDKHEFVIFVPKLKQTIPFKIEDIPIYEMRSFPFPPYPGYNIAYPTIRFNHALKKEKFDLIHCHSPFSLGYGAILLARVFNDLPLLNTYHTHLVLYSGHLIGGFQAERFSKAISQAVWGYVRAYYRFSDVVVTPSKTLQRDLITHGVSPPVYALPNMISRVFFKKNIDPMKDKIFQNELKQRFKIKPEHRVILYCGRISFEKKLEVTLRAFKNLEKKNPNAFLLIVGDGPHLNSYKKQALDLNLENYAFTGFISHTKLPVVYRMGEFMVTPSDTETQGLTVIEAMSQKLPVIGVAGGGVMDNIKHEINGFLVKPGDVNAFSEAMITLFNNDQLRETMGKNAYKTALKFSQDGFISLLESAFKKTIEIHSSKKSKSHFLLE